MGIERRKLQGVLNILSFNRHFYFFGFIALALIVTSTYFITWHTYLYYITLAGFAYGLIMPLLVSAYVYDLSGFYDFDWLRRMQLSDSPESYNLNINAGFDETSYLIKEILPHSKLQVYDFYDADRHTEAAIVRARKVSSVYPNTQHISTTSFPLEEDVIDNIFLISAAHEIRSQEEKILFLKECKRVCKSGGQIIMVEHLRDLPNFLAFSIGFTHFFSSSTWQQAFSEAGFSKVEEDKFTSFMSIFKCTKDGDTY